MKLRDHDDHQNPYWGAALLFAVCFLITRPNLRNFFSLLNIDETHYSFAVQMACINTAFLILYPLLTKRSFADLGLKNIFTGPRDALNFFIIGLFISNGCFLVFTSRWKDLVAFDNRLEIVFFAVIPVMLWGFFQELVYRGLLQKELTVKLGSIKGILISNLIFTFGTIHFFHFKYIAENPAHIMMFVFIFLSGLFFGWTYNRFKNIWLTGIFHGIGSIYLDGIGVANAFLK